MDVAQPCNPARHFAAGAANKSLGPITAVQPRQRVQVHIQLPAIFWFAISAFNAICGVVLYILANTLLAPGGSTGAPVFLRPLLSMVAIVVFGGAALGIFGGSGPAAL